MICWDITAQFLEEHGEVNTYHARKTNDEKDSDDEMDIDENCLWLKVVRGDVLLNFQCLQTANYIYFFTIVYPDHVFSYFDTGR